MDSKDRIRTIVSKIIKVSPSQLAETDDLIEKHGMDSLARVEIVTELEKEFDVLIDDTEALGLVSLKKCFELVEKKTLK